MRWLKFCSSDWEAEAVTRSEESSDVFRSALLELVVVELDSWRDSSWERFAAKRVEVLLVVVTWEGMDTVRSSVNNVFV